MCPAFPITHDSHHALSANARSAKQQATVVVVNFGFDAVVVCCSQIGFFAFKIQYSARFGFRLFV